MSDISGSTILSDFGIKLDKKLKSKLWGRDVLTVMRKTDTENCPIGGMCIDIKKGEGVQENNFLVCISTKFRLDDNAIGISKLLSWVDENLCILEEKRTEIVKRDDTTMEKRDIYSTRTCDGGLYMQLFEQKTGNMLLRHPKSKVNSLICEGSNMILLKCLAILKCRIPKDKLTRTLTIEGAVCDNAYTVNFEDPDYPEQLYLTRTITMPKGHKSVSHAVVGVCGSFTGKILQLKWDDHDIIVVPQPVDTSLNFTEQSAYTKRLHDNKAHLKNQVSKKPNLITILDDYLQDLLFHKPDDVLKFTNLFFTRLNIHKPTK